MGGKKRNNKKEKKSKHKEKSVDLVCLTVNLQCNIEHLRHINNIRKQNIIDKIELISLETEPLKVSEILNQLYTSCKYIIEYRKIVEYFRKLDYPNIRELKDSDIKWLTYGEFKKQVYRTTQHFEEGHTVHILNKLLERFQQYRNEEPVDIEMLWNIFTKVWELVNYLKVYERHHSLKDMYTTFDNLVLPPISLEEERDKKKVMNDLFSFTPPRF